MDPLRLVVSKLGHVTQTPEKIFWMLNAVMSKILFVLITCAAFLMMWFG